MHLKVLRLNAGDNCILLGLARQCLLLGGRLSMLSPASGKDRKTGELNKAAAVGHCLRSPSPSHPGQQAALGAFLSLGSQKSQHSHVRFLLHH